MPQVNITVGIQQNSENGWYYPSSVAAVPDKVPVPLGQGRQSINFQLQAAAGSPPTTKIFFTQNANGWGNVNGITFKPVAVADVHFPPHGWSSARKDAFVAALQAVVDTLVPTTSGPNGEIATVAFDPATLEAGQAFEIDLQYSVNYFINVDGTSYGPNTYDPEVDIDPPSR
jgi:hypothetical protein